MRYTVTGTDSVRSFTNIDQAITYAQDANADDGAHTQVLVIEDGTVAWDSLLWAHARKPKVLPPSSNA